MFHHWGARGQICCLGILTWNAAVNRTPSLQDLVHAFFVRRLLLPFAVMCLCALITVVVLQLQELYRAQKFFAKVLDRYATTLFSGAHKALRERALYYGESVSLGKELVFPFPMGFHRIFVFEASNGPPFEGRFALRVPASVNIPLSYFPRGNEWPAVSIPYFNGQLNTVTVAIVVRGDRFAAVGELNLDSLKSLIRNFAESDPNNLVLIVDRYGNALYHPDPRILQSQENLAHEPLIKRVLRYSSPQTVLDKLGGRFVLGYCWRVHPWDWVIVVGKPLVHAVVPSLLWGTMAAAVGLLLLFTLLVSFRRRIGRIFVDPMMHMTATVEAISHDSKVKDLEAITRGAPFLELAVFAEGLRRMAQAVVEREAALVSQSRELHRILESIGEGVIVTDASGNVVRMNAEAESLTGWSRIQALGRPVQNIFSVFDAKTGKPLEDFVFHVMASGAPRIASGHALLKAADGSEVFVMHSAAPVRGESGELQGVVVVFHDVSAEFTAKKLLEESERKYREIMDTMEEAYMELDPKGRVTFCNPALLKILGCSWDDLQNRTYRDFTDATTAESMEAFFSQIFATGAHLGLQDFLIRDASGRRKVVEISAGVRRA
ncbi:PAS domain-containing protein, partial [Desulfosoma sp.]